MKKTDNKKTDNNMNTSTAVKYEPVIVALPNTVETKMAAIAAVARSNEALARALESINVHVHISDCQFAATPEVQIK